MMIIYGGCLCWLSNSRPLEFINGQPNPVLGVFSGPTYLNPPWSVSI